MDGCRVAHIFGSQGTGQGKLRRPMQLSVTVSGTLAVADSDNRRVSLWDTHKREFLCCAGGKSRSKDDSFKAAVQAVATTAAGTILVADTAASAIRLYHLASNESSGVRAVLERVSKVYQETLVMWAPLRLLVRWECCAGLQEWFTWKQSTVLLTVEA